MSASRSERPFDRGLELLDMVVGVTGKNLERIQQILKSGTLVYHSYRYWWPGFDAESKELSSLLAQFPEAEPSRPFRTQECTALIFDHGIRELRPPQLARLKDANRIILICPRTSK